MKTLKASTICANYHDIGRQEKDAESIDHESPYGSCNEVSYLLWKANV